MVKKKEDIEKIKVAITDDHNLLAGALKSVIDREKDMKVSIVANNGKMLLDQLEKKETPDVLILDIEMPVMDGFKTVENLVEKYSDIKIIILSMFSQQNVVSTMLSYGVSGYLKKNSTTGYLLEAIRKVADDGVVYCDEALKVSQLMHNRNGKPFASKSEFTTREMEIIKLTCEEYTNTEISEKLCISKSTVEFHKRSVFKKMNVKSSAGCVNFAHVNRII